MIRPLPFTALFVAFFCTLASAAEEPLRIFIRSGPKFHGPGAHDYPRFLREWVPLLNDRGARATGADAFPTKAQLEQTDVLILHAQEAGTIPAVEDRANLNAFLQRGGGIVVIHAAAVSADPDWYKSIIGGSWRNGTTRWLEGPMHLYFTDRESPITRDCSNWSMDDEIYYDMDMLPAARVLAAAYTPKASGARNASSQRRAMDLTGGGKKVSIYDVQPQMWTYERTIDAGSVPYRAFVSIPGHYYETFNRPNYRAILLRGIAWAGRRQNVDQLCRPEELGENLRYVEGGPTSPAKAASKIEVHPDFTLNLVAAEPLINKVMNLDWDERGRLWVCETPEYPNGRRTPKTEPWKDSGSVLPYQQERDARDRISILTDTDGDGIMDKSHVFADKLELVTSFVLYKNGVIAATAPDIWFLEDTDGDGVADKRTKLYTGLGIFDTHAVINNLRWGLDGWIYATHGYSRGEVTSPDGSKPFGSGGSGVVRFEPDGSAFEQYSSRGGNTWGLDITWDGQLFWTQPTSGTVLFHTVLPESVLAKAKLPGTTSWKGMIVGQKTYPALQWPEQAYVQIDQVGRFTAAAGCAIYEGGAWPEQWRYSYFAGEPTLNIVHHQFVKPDGVSYTTAKETGREETEFIRSTDLWFRPIDTRIGPDGALYIVDFYNQAVIHNDTRGPQHGPANAAVRPDRDHYFSRIWRVQHKQAKVLPVPALDRQDLAGLLRAIETSPNVHVKKTAWRLVRENHGAAGEQALANLNRPMGSKALARYDQARAAATTAQRQSLLTEYAGATEDWTKSAILAGAIEGAADFILDAFASPDRTELAGFASALAPWVQPASLDRLLRACVHADASSAKGADRTSSRGAKAISPEIAFLHGLSQWKDPTPVITPSIEEALRTLIQKSDTAAAALPLVAKWDRSGRFTIEMENVTRTLLADLADTRTPAIRRADLAISLLAVPQSRSETLAKVGAFVADAAIADLVKAPVIAAAGELNDPRAVELLIATYARLKSTPIFEALLKRPESTLQLLSAIKAGTITVADLGPGNVARLRTHPNRQVASEAATLFAAISPQTKQRDELIAKLAPEVEKPGDAVIGKVLYTTACAICHRNGEVGVVDVGPPLAGMGAHGPSELLVHILDPNREVEPSFTQWNLVTKKGETFVGVIANENSASLTLRNQGGDVEVQKDDIASRDNTGRSLMPEGFEGLGAEGLRDLLTYLCGGEQAFRVLDLREAYTADARRGMFRRADVTDENVSVHKFGNVVVGGIPFFVMDPAKSPNGRNIIALKGGPGSDNASDEYPQRVEIPISAPAASLHFLGGVGGWAWPMGGDSARGQPAMKVTARFADGSSEEHVLKNGEHFVDYKNPTAEVPLSINAGDFMHRGQLRYFALNLSKRGTLKSLVLESFDNDLVPCTVAVTASAEPAKATAPATASAAPALGPKAGGPGDAPLPATAPVTWEPGKTRVLLIGGGSSHNFGKFFGETDGGALRAAGFSVNYTEDRDQAAAELASADVAVISVNRRYFDTPAYRQALFAFAAAGKGIVMLHPGAWYGYAQWPELNAKIVGGGARGHDRIGTFSVSAVKANHPVMKGVPASFDVEDELYYINAEPDKIPPGTAAIEVLAETSPSQKYGKPHPSVWITKHDRARIVGIALGHDQRVHDLAAFKTLLANAVNWAK